MNPVHVYDLSFISKKVSESHTPEIVISIRRPYVGMFKERIFRLIGGDGGAAEYLHEDAPFALFEGGRYGYRWCCRVVERPEARDIHFELYDFQSRHTAMTLYKTLLVLRSCFGEEVFAEEAEPRQYLDVQTICRDTIHGHTVEGWVFPSFGRWLAAQGRGQKPPKAFSSEMYTGKSFAPVVKAAMAEAWEALAPLPLKKHKRNCGAGIQEDGRFLLCCFGNACDMGIYPDTLGSGMGKGIVRFASHNLENHVQQLTFIAGLAALVEEAARVEVSP
jgi:hypothetical protein